MIRTTEPVFPETIDELRETARSFYEEARETKAELYRRELAYAELEEKYRILKQKLYGRSSEQWSPEELAQARLFNEAEMAACAEETEEAPETVVMVAAHPKRCRGKRLPLPDDLPREEVVYDIPEEDKTCACGNERRCIGEKTSEKLDIEPPKLKVIRIIRKTYACPVCEGSGDESKPAVITAPAPPQLIEKGIATPGLVSYIVVSKYCDALPLNRQEKIFKRFGIDLPRETMGRWVMTAGGKIEPLLSRYDRLIREGPIVNMDETTVQVHREHGRSDTSDSYMWVAVGGPPGSRVVRYLYSPTRAKEVPLSYLSGYKGYLQTDGYEGYTRIGSALDITHVGCLAHVRREFMDALKAAKGVGSAHEAVSRIGKIYQVEQDLRRQGYPADEFIRLRKEKAGPLLSAFHTWLSQKAMTATPSGQLGKAVSYALSEWPKIIRYLEHAALTPDNNVAERAIRPFVIGRRNWLFSDTPRGAHASAAWYSLIETAKLNGIEPYYYIRDIVNKCPLIVSDDEWEEFLPERYKESRNL